MRRRVVVALLIVSVSLSALIVTPSVAASEANEDEFVVRLPEGDGAESREDLVEHAEETQDEVVAEVRSEGGEVVRRFWLTNAILVHGDDELRESLDEREDLRVHDNYGFAAPTAVGPSKGGGSEGEGSGFEAKPGVKQVNATAVWEVFGVRGEGVSVAVLDTGVAVEHPDIQLRTTDPGDPRYPGGWAEFDGGGERVNSTPHDSAEHGTHVSGTVVGGNASGTWIGVAPEADLMHAKVFGNDTGTFASVLAGMEWSVAEGADVLSLSFGVPCDNGTVYARSMVGPVRNAQAAGSLVVASAGNGGEGCSTSPANVYDSLAVGAVDGDGNVPSFSGGGSVETAEAWGEDAPSDWPASYVVPGVTAPGVGVLSAIPGGSHERMDGTSMATPHVAGVAALVESSTERDLTPEEVRSVILRTAKNPGDGDGVGTRGGAGVVDAYRAVSAAQNGINTTDPLSVPVNTTADSEEGDGNQTQGSPSSPLPGFGIFAGVAAILLLIIAQKIISGRRQV